MIFGWLQFTRICVFQNHVFCFPMAFYRECKKETEVIEELAVVAKGCMISIVEQNIKV